MTLKSRATELQETLCKLKPLLGSEHAQILAVARELATTYHEQGKHRKAGSLFRYVAKTTQKIHGLANEGTLDLWLEVVDCLQDEGKAVLARNLLNKLHPKILKLAQPGHDLATKSMYLMCNNNMNLEDWNGTEDLIRHVLQMKLSTLGPLSKGTWKCMIKLGTAISRNDRIGGWHLVESDKLLYNALHLIRRCHDPKNDKYVARTVNRIAMNCRMTGQYKEADAICRAAIETLEGSLGLGNAELIGLYGRIAWNCLHQRQFEESETFHRKVLNLCAASWEEPFLGLKFAEGPGIALEQLGRMDEAASCYERSYRGFLESFPPESERVLSICYGLGQFYRAHDRNGDALRLFGDHIREMRKTSKTEELDPDIQPALTRVQQWMSGQEPAPFGIRDNHLLVYWKEMDILDDKQAWNRDNE